MITQCQVFPFRLDRTVLGDNALLNIIKYNYSFLKLFITIKTAIAKSKLNQAFVFLGGHV